MIEWQESIKLGGYIMEKYIYDEKNGLWYELQGDYYIPCLELPDEEQRPWGQRHLRYLRRRAARAAMR